jgi:signal transduction histidine kinase
MNPQRHVSQSHLVGRSHRSLAAQIITVQEEERARIARELHDNICQQLSLLALDLDQLRTRISESVAQEGIASAVDNLGHIVDDVQNISRRLHPSIVRDLGLSAAIRSECMHFEDSHGIPVHFSSDKPMPELSQENELAVFRIVQEALHNVAKHAHASHVHVCLYGSQNDVCLRIEDSGAGFDVEEQRVGLGLASMRERAALANGTISIRSIRGQGTVIELIVPLGSTPTPPMPSQA